MIFPCFFTVFSLSWALMQTSARLSSSWVSYQKMQNFKGFQMLDSNHWDSHAQKNVGRKIDKMTSLNHRPPSLVKGKSITKHFVYDCWHLPFCRELLAASFETLFSFVETNFGSGNLKIRENMKKRIFLVKLRELILVTTR